MQAFFEAMQRLYAAMLNNQAASYACDATAYLVAHGDRASEIAVTRFWTLVAGGVGPYLTSCATVFYTALDAISQDIRGQLPGARWSAPGEQNGKTMDEEQHAEIIARLDRIEGTVGEVKALAEKTNGRVTQLEGWKIEHGEEHQALTALADMASTIAEIRRFVLFVLPFLTIVSAVGGVVAVLKAVL